MNKIKFEHRYRSELENRLQQVQSKLQKNRSEISAAAVLFSRRLWRKGKWHPQILSPFLQRINKSDKLTVWVRFTPEVYLYLTKMARASGCSLAEMLRLALNVFCSYTLRDGVGIVRQVVSKRRRADTIRIRGINVLDHIDHRADGIGGVWDFEICNIRDIGSRVLKALI